MPVAITILMDFSDKINANGENHGNGFATSCHVLITKILFSLHIFKAYFEITSIEKA